MRDRGWSEETQTADHNDRETTSEGIKGEGGVGGGDGGSNSRVFFLSILWLKFGYIPNDKSYLFFQIFVLKFPILKIRKYVVKQRFLEGLKQEKMLY